MTREAGTHHPLRRRELATWSLVALIGTMMMIPLNALIPAFYAKNTATSLAQIGAILLIARLFDAVADPLVGYLSDRTQSRWGRRKPWILAGGSLACLANYLLFHPADTATGAYLLPVMLLFYAAYSMMIVPHSAWGSELSRSYAQRSLISGAMTFAGVVGLLLFMGLPVLLSSPLVRLFPTAEVTPPMLGLLGWLLVVTAPICIVVAVTATPSGVTASTEAVHISDVITSLRVNRPFWIFLTGYAAMGLGYGVYYATTYLFIDSYLGMADTFALIYGTTAIAQMASIPVWTRLSERYERSRIWAIGIVAFGLLLPLRLLVQGGAAGFPEILLVTVLASMANAASQVPQMAVLADCIDYGTLRTGANLAGSYYALQQFALKASLAAGGAVAFLLLGWLHYDARASHHTAQSLTVLATVHTVLPLLLFGCSGAALWLFPLNRRRQAIMRRSIERHQFPAATPQSA